MVEEEKLNRTEIQNRIALLEDEIYGLRSSLPSPCLNFYRFRITVPARSYIMVYAGDRASAEKQVNARLAREYGEGQYQLHPVVDEYNDPFDANANCHLGSSLCECLERTEANQFVKDFAELPPREPGKRKSGLELDIEAYRRKHS